MKLIIPSEEYYSSYVDAINEYQTNNVTSHDFLDVEKYNIFEQITNFRDGTNLPAHYVRATYLWLIDDDEFVGKVSIRHSLTPDLLRYGGNIGYGIRYSKWNMGYGTIMLAKALLYAKETIGLDKALTTCNDDNIGSARVIEKNGGVLQDKIVNCIDGKEFLTRRYWISL